MASPRSLVLLALLGACTVHTSETTVWNTRACLLVEDRTGEEVVVLECPAAVDVFLAELDLKCRQGDVQVRLVDPDGVVRYREHLRAGERDCRLHLEPTVGEWRCTLALSDFTGSWSVKLQANSEPRLAAGVRVTDLRIIR